MSKKSSEAVWKYEFPVKFSGARQAKNGVAIGLSFSRNDVDLKLADEVLASSQLSCKLTVKSTKDVEGQLLLDGKPVKQATVEAVGSVHGYSVKTDRFSATLTIPDRNRLAELGVVGFRSGTLRCTRLGPAEAAKPKNASEGEDVEDQCTFDGEDVD